MKNIRILVTLVSGLLNIFGGFLLALNISKLFRQNPNQLTFQKLGIQKQIFNGRQKRLEIVATHQKNGNKLDFHVYFVNGQFDLRSSVQNPEIENYVFDIDTQPVQGDTFNQFFEFDVGNLIVVFEFQFQFGFFVNPIANLFMLLFDRKVQKHG